MLGLGLALAKASSSAQFEVRLPHASSRPPAPVRTTSPVQVLLVEDNVDAAEMLQTLLELKGHGVARADCAEAALKVLRERMVDVVLCDLGLPDMRGLELCENVRNELGLRELFMVAVTGFGQPHDRERTQATGFNHHLVKPVELQTLTDVLAVKSLCPARPTDQQLDPLHQEHFVAAALFTLGAYPFRRGSSELLR